MNKNNSFQLHKHSCPDCAYLGSGNIDGSSSMFNYYFCKNPAHSGVVARYGSSPNASYSGMWLVHKLLTKIKEENGFNSLADCIDSALAKAKKKDIDKKSLMYATSLAISAGFMNENLDTITSGEAPCPEEEIYSYSDSKNGIFVTVYYVDSEDDSSKGLRIVMIKQGKFPEMAFRSIYFFAKNVDNYERSFLEHNEEIANVANYFTNRDEDGVELPTVNTFLWKAMVEAFKLEKFSFEDFYKYF